VGAAFTRAAEPVTRKKKKSFRKPRVCVVIIHLGELGRNRACENNNATARGADRATLASGCEEARPRKALFVVRSKSSDTVLFRAERALVERALGVAAPSWCSR
jgi:hypothetical protein